MASSLRMHGDSQSLKGAQLAGEALKAQTGGSLDG